MQQCRHHRLALMLLVFVSIGVTRVQGHGRLVEPPSRASAWRYGFSTEKDYNDSELYCGGWSRQHQRNGGKCGVCGDAWDMPQPRAHEHGGRYGQATIVRTYKMNADIEIGVELTANHQGYFEFRLCEHNLAKTPETDECFDRHVLRRADADAGDALSHRYFPGAGSNIVFRSVYKLPEGVTCAQCVLQWRYVAGNNWGRCPNGTEKVGCGPQEHFFGCADIKISVDGVPDTTPPPTTPKTTSSTTTSTLKPRTRGTVTSRYTRPTKTTPLVQSTSSSSTTGYHTESTTTTTESTRETNEYGPPVHQFNDFNPGPYIGVIITLATLLFAIVCVCGTILYFYHFHTIVKSFIGEQWRLFRSRVDASERKAPLKLPASVFAQTEPPPLSTVGDVKPPVPPRIRRTGDLRLLSLTISEPLDVTINGISVPRDGASPTAPVEGEETNVSLA